MLRIWKKKWMWFDAAKTVGNWVVWYPAPPGAKFLPHGNRFTSETWDYTHFWNPGAGEDDATNPLPYNGKMPFPVTGQRHCGKADWFRHGQPSDAPPLDRSAIPPIGFPTCCSGGGEFDDSYTPDYLI